ncbi:MAG: GHKL domain-containing protein [Anaerovoracaceae bacterium]
MYIISRFFHVFFQTDGSKKRKLVRFSGYVLYYCINSASFLYLDWAPKIIILTNIVGSIILASSYIGTWKYRICAIVAVVASYTVCEDLVYNLLVNLHIERMLVTGILAADFLFFMIVLLLQKVIDLKNGDDIAFLEWLSIVLIPICSLFVSAIVLDNCKDEIAVAIGGISMILVNVFAFYLLDRIQCMYKSLLDVTLLEQQNQAYENQMLLSKASEEKITMLRHDMKNHFLALHQLAEKDKCKEIQKYLDSLKPLAEMGTNFASTGNYVIDSFLNVKLGKAIQYGTEVKTDLKISNDISISHKDISIILGNLLDNALRAIENCDNGIGKKILHVTMKEEPGKLFIQMENSHSESIRKVDNTFKTTKAKEVGHGIGLKNVQRVVDAYHGHMEIDYTDDSFLVRLFLFLQ